MDKKGLLGKIFLLLLIILIIILLVIGISAYQAYNLFKVVKAEGPTISSNINAMLLAGIPDCSKINKTENSINIIYSEAKSTCKNPLIKMLVEKTEKIPIKCSQLSEYKASFEGNLTQVKRVCSNETLMNILKPQNI